MAGLPTVINILGSPFLTSFFTEVRMSWLIGVLVVVLLVVVIVSIL